MDPEDGTDIGKIVKPPPKFSKCILKSVIGEERANQVLTSLSMAQIPNAKINSLENLNGHAGGKCFFLFYHKTKLINLLTFLLFSLAAFQASKSTNDLGNMFRSQIL